MLPDRQRSVHSYEEIHWEKGLAEKRKMEMAWRRNEMTALPYMHHRAGRTATKEEGGRRTDGKRSGFGERDVDSRHQVQVGKATTQNRGRSWMETSRP